MNQMALSFDNTTSGTNCAACGKEGGNLNTCNKCKMVKYCNAACKKKHRSKHMKACKKRVAELHDEELFKEHPPRDECPICFLPLPFHARQTTFESCCGKVICSGCTVAMAEEARGRGGEIGLCAFCRTPSPTTGEEESERMKKMAESGIAMAIYNIGVFYNDGLYGFPVDFTKANEFFLKAGELGCAVAYYNLSTSYRNGEGVDVDKEKAKYFCELAAMNGDARARYSLGCMEVDDGNEHRACKHFILSAKAGFKKSLDAVKIGFMDGIITKDEYETLYVPTSSDMMR